MSLITIRNGNRAMQDKYPKVYAEKLLYMKEGQYSPKMCIRDRTIPRCPLFGFAEGNPEIGAGDRRIGDGKVKKQ